MKAIKNWLLENTPARRERLSWNLKNDRPFYKDLGAEPSKLGKQNE